MKGYYYEVDATREEYMVMEDLKRVMDLKLKPNAPRSAPRIVVIGAPGSGKTTLSKLIAKKFDLIHVSTGNLLKGEIARETKEGKESKNLISKGELVSDDMMIKLIMDRLKENDCKVNGWVLEGFPKTKDQLTAYLQHKELEPSLVVALKLNAISVLERHEYKRVDPITGQIYNLKQGPVPEKEVLERLVQYKEDTETIVKKRLAIWDSFATELEEDLKAHKLLSIEAVRSVNELAEVIYQAIENPFN